MKLAHLFKDWESSVPNKTIPEYLIGGLHCPNNLKEDIFNELVELVCKSYHGKLDVVLNWLEMDAMFGKKEVFINHSKQLSTYLTSITKQLYITFKLESKGKGSEKWCVVSFVGCKDFSSINPKQKRRLTGREIHAQSQKVYLITDGEYYKVGIALKPTHRLTELQVGNARQLSIVETYLPDGSALDVEQAIHKKLRDCHVSGEWFKNDSLPDIFTSLCKEFDK